MCLYIFVHINIKLNNVFKKEISIQICKLGNALNANESYPWMLMRICLLAMLGTIGKLTMLMIIEKMYFYKNKSVTPCINQTVIIVLVNYEESIKIVNFLYPAWIRVLVLWLAIIDFKVKIYYFDILWSFSLLRSKD